MKKLVLRYAFLAILLLAALSVLNYLGGGGYVYLLWFGVQVQTNIWILMYSVLLVSFAAQIFYFIYQHIFVKEQRKLQQVSDFDALHPYEQLGLIWLLDAEDDQAEYVQRIFNASGLLSHVIEARLLSRQNRYEDALMVLDKAPMTVYEVVALQKIEIYLNQSDAENALKHLSLIVMNEISPWLSSLDQAFRQRVEGLWARLALEHPWAFLKAPFSVQLNAMTMQKWLTHLLLQFEQADQAQLLLLQQRFLMLEQQIKLFTFDAAVLWLKLIVRLPDLARQQTALALNLLEQKFDQDVFLLWFQQQFMVGDADLSQLEADISVLVERYPSLPILSFAQWHIYMATHRIEEAQALLSLYPENIFMSYLRVKSALGNHHDLLEQLKLVFENDANFIEFKI